MILNNIKLHNFSIIYFIINVIYAAYWLSWFKRVKLRNYLTGLFLKAEILIYSYKSGDFLWSSKKVKTMLLKPLIYLIADTCLILVLQDEVV